MTTRPLILAIAVLAMSLGACSRSPDSSPAETEGLNAIASPSSQPSEARDVPAVTPAQGGVLNATAELPPVTEPLNDTSEASAELPADAPVDQQVMDDAAATGMTSRASREARGADHPPPTENEPK